MLGSMRFGVNAFGVAVVVAIACSGCLAKAANECGDGTTCPIDKVCVSGGCALPEQLTACMGAADGTPCGFAGTSGTCIEQVCVGSPCGNGVLDPDEVCDDGNTVSGDGCRRDCMKIETCGDGTIDASEGCDDGNQTGGDGCGPTCHIEACGNGVLDPNEACDDSNNHDGDGCSADCRSNETCGNGLIDHVAGEECDDGNFRGQDGCSSTCAIERPTWSFDEAGNSGDLAPLTHSAMAYDAQRGVVVVFGGTDPSTNDNFYTHEWNGARWIFRRPSTSPGPTAYHAMAYDGRRGRVVTYGGWSGTTDTWEWNGASWEQILTATNPGPRYWYAMTYDAGRGRVVLFGSAGYDADVWEWDGTTWSQHTCAMNCATSWPSGRLGPSLAYDARRGKVVMFGGGDANLVALADTWEWDGTSWQNVTPTTGPGPVANYLAPMTYDARRERVVLASGAFGDGTTWEWDGTSWQNVTEVGPPQPPNGAGMMAYDVARDQIVLRVDSFTEPTTWLRNGTTWTPWDSTSVKAPGGGSMVYEPLRGRSLLFQAGPRTAEWDGTRLWIQSPSDSPSGRLFPPMAYDPQRDRVVLFGANSPNLYNSGLADTWEWVGATWIRQTPAASPPSYASKLVYDDKRGRIVLHNGSYSADDNVWEYDGATWTAVPQTGTYPQERWPGLVYDPKSEQVLLFGGRGHSNTLMDNSTWAWDAAWTEQATAPAVRAAPGMAYDPGRGTVVMYGGIKQISTSNVFLSSVWNDTWEWRGSWKLLQPENAGPGLNYGDSMVYEALDERLLTSTGWTLLWQSRRPHEVCPSGFDVDGDGLAGCADPDCWGYCAPLCPPGSTCSTASPHCGDGACGAVETCRLCPGDCGACPLVCGDMLCDAGETHATCPGDCP